MILSEVEEIITTMELDEETFEEIYKVLMYNTYNFSYIGKRKELIAVTFLFYIMAAWCVRIQVYLHIFRPHVS